MSKPTMVNRSEPASGDCVRCGECCKGGGPALHEEDADLLRSGVLLAQDLVTLRAGELASDPEKGELLPLGAEAVKIAPSPGSGWTCRKFDAQARRCRIYANRPVECRVLDCRNASGLLAMYRHGRLTRADIVGEASPLMDLARALDEACPPARVREAAFALRSGGASAAAELARMLRMDLEIRRLAVERGADPLFLPLLLGRPQRDVLKPLGFEVVEGPDGLQLRDRRGRTQAESNG
jgi:Fe-S-cluster containining protein